MEIWFRVGCLTGIISKLHHSINGAFNNMSSVVVLIRRRGRNRKFQGCKISITVHHIQRHVGS